MKINLNLIPEKSDSYDLKIKVIDEKDSKLFTSYKIKMIITFSDNSFNKTLSFTKKTDEEDIKSAAPSGITVKNKTEEKP